MAPQSKVQYLNDVYNHLKKRYKPKPEKVAARMTVLEAVVYAICREGTTREQANQALSRFKDGFFDWNEIRVSTVEEVQSALAGIPDSEPRAARIRRFLRQLFEKTYAFSLEALTKKPLKESLKTLKEYEAFQSDYVEASVVRLSLGGHALPVDAPMRRVMERLGVASPDDDPASLRGLLERAIPKNRAAEFIDLTEELAQDVCLEGEPDCPRCELRKGCPTSHARKEEAAAAAKQAAAAARVAAKEKEKAAREAVKEKEKEKEKEKAKQKPKEKVAVAKSKESKPVVKAAAKAAAKPSAKTAAKAAAKPAKGRGK
jgi:endonuclease-3